MKFYTYLSKYYDEMIDWNKRLETEWPFFKHYFDLHSVRSVLDLGSGTGQHAIFLAGKGFKVTGIEPDAEMINVSRAKIPINNENPQFFNAGFEQIADLTMKPFDCILCIGNTLPYVDSENILRTTLKDIKSSLTENGVFITQSRNFDLMKKGENRFLPLSAHKSSAGDRILLRFYDVNDAHAALNLVEIFNVDGIWKYTLNSSQQFPIFKQKLIDSLVNAGFKELDLYGDFKFSTFDISRSSDLIVVAKSQ